MDTSETHIKMSEKAWPDLRDALKDKIDYRKQGYCTLHHCLVEEDQEGDECCPGFGKLYYDTRLKQGISEARELFGGEEDCRWNNRWIGLPYQDQLQEMLDDRFSNRYSCVLAEKFGIYCSKLTTDSGRFVLSMEQLWLAFVMKEKYGKVWDSSKEEWL